MNEPYGMHVQFLAKPGKGDELAAILAKAAAGTELEAECRFYLVSRAPERAEMVYVTEAWTSREAHDRSLQEEPAKALIAQAMPLLDGPPSAVGFVPAAGAGFSA